MYYWNIFESINWTYSINIEEIDIFGTKSQSDKKFQYWSDATLDPSTFPIQYLNKLQLSFCESEKGWLVEVVGSISYV